MRKGRRIMRDLRSRSRLALAAIILAVAPSSEALAQLPPHAPGTICVTPQGWCWVPQGYLGTPCFCGMVQGVRA